MSLLLVHHVHDGSAYRSREELAAGWPITPAVGHPGVAEIKRNGVSR